MSDPLDDYISLLETLDTAALDALSERLTDDVHFRDPFNDVTGPAAFRRIFADMQEKLDDIHFRVDAQAWCAPRDGLRVALIHWQLAARLKQLGGRPWQVSGCSELHFTDDDRLAAHLDYWDAAGGLYELLPIAGIIFRWLRRRLTV
ncbi:MAG: nuclear transport factor 2 family protein [Gammaproteobacteria bacterium]